MFKTEDFDYCLPKKFIAQNPLSKRDESKLLVYDSLNDYVSHKMFLDVGNLLKKGDVIVVNVSRVIPARIIFYENEKEREIFVLKRIVKNRYQVMVRPGNAFKKGATVLLRKGVRVFVLEVLEDGTRIVDFLFDNKVDDAVSFINEIGQIPFPPYVGKTSATPDQYQTVYAKNDGSVAAPTAGLHFTPELISKLKNAGIEFEEIVLHVGRGTFLPVKSEYVKDHKMHAESYSLSKNTALNLNKAKKEGRRIIAVGTTTVRVLESCYDLEDGFISGEGETDIFIYPENYKWKAVDSMITNYHLPKSTLLMLVASFLEHKGSKTPVKKLMDLYDIAKKNDYRFYSFGDAMFIF